MPQPLAINGNLLTLIGTYSNISTVSKFSTVLSTANAKVAANVFSVANENAIGNLNCSYQPLLNQYTVAGKKYQYKNALQAHMNNILPTNYTIFTQVFDVSLSFCQQVNESITTSNTASSYLGTTFTSMNDLTTGGFSSVSTDLPKFGADLKLSGSVINLKHLNEFGLPSRLLLNIKEQGQGFIGFEPELIKIGITKETIAKFGKSTFQFTASVEKQIFQAMQLVTGSSLTQILKVLGCTTPNILKLSDLLDLKKIFPLSFSTLTSPSVQGLSPIFVNGSVNNLFSNLGVPLGVVTTPALASSNTAFATSMKNIKSISTKTVQQIADVVATLQTNAGLGFINALTSPLIPGATVVLNNQAQGGSGAGGTVVLGDLIGSVAGYKVNSAFQNVNSSTTTIVNSGVANVLVNSTNGVFTVMTNTLNGDYGPPTGPITGLPAGPWTPGEPFADLDLAFSTPTYGLTAVAQSSISNVVANIDATYSSQAANGTAAWTILTTKLANETENLALAGVDFAEIAPLPASSMLSWVSSFPQYALDTAAGGAKEIVFGVIDSNTLSGQCVIATIRESENLAKLDAVGVGTDNKIGQYTPLMLNTAALLINSLP